MTIESTIQNLREIKDLLSSLQGLVFAPTSLQLLPEEKNLLGMQLQRLLKHPATRILTYSNVQLLLDDILRVIRLVPSVSNQLPWTAQELLMLRGVHHPEAYKAPPEWESEIYQIMALISKIRELVQPPIWEGKSNASL